MGISCSPVVINYRRYVHDMVLYASNEIKGPAAEFGCVQK